MYGAVSSTSRRVGVLNAPMSFVCCLPCNVEATQLRKAFGVGQYIRVKLVDRAACCFLLNATGQFFQVVVPGRDASVVKLVIGEERHWLCNFVAGDALGSGLKQLPSSPLRFGDSALVTCDKAIERRVVRN